MYSHHLRNILLLLAVVAITLPSFFCNSPGEEQEATQTSPWQNVYDTNAHYVGMDKCRTCHESIYQTFIETGMGQSFDYASKQKSSADFAPAHALVYDKALGFYYKPYWQGDSLYVLEFRLEGSDTVHKRKQKIDYIIGSGQHTNSHIFSRSGYLHQAPITFYTQKKQWDLAPGYEEGNNYRFSRLIELECMSCHNAYPEFEPASQNKFISVGNGIDCERCHGPGSLHVAAKQAGDIVDTSKTPDYTIVNPRRLSTDLQNNICQRCHLQGIAVLNDGKSFFDFRPGMQLSEVMNVFMPQYEGARDKMIMASHVERMKKSDCFISSGKMSCITCHKPHVSVKFTPHTQYLDACKSCHGDSRSACTEKLEIRARENDDCVKCHMPRNGSIDIPHVAVTDHFIRKRPMSDTLEKKITAFLGLQCFNNDKVDAITQGRAFMEFYEKFNQNRALIDSAIKYLDKEKDREASEKQNRDYIRAYFLLSDFAKVTQYAAKLYPENIVDAWAAYRIGESYFQLQKHSEALPWYKRATEMLRFSLDFQNKYGTCLLALNRLSEAQKVFDFVLKEDPDYVSANTNIGFIYMQQNNLTMAYYHLLKANTLDPDHQQTIFNLAILYHGEGKDDKAKALLLRLLRSDPQNERARMMLSEL
ncbi:MAG TPA: tetratricopeptide repeat protein [Flavipsychrobacter sp.]|nr:tetratricopeptide repeat protein [Flavipsychrobacter sp.]